jgi:hypothetical protein
MQIVQRCLTDLGMFASIMSMASVVEVEFVGEDSLRPLVIVDSPRKPRGNWRRCSTMQGMRIYFRMQPIRLRRGSPGLRGSEMRIRWLVN